AASIFADDAAIAWLLSNKGTVIDPVMAKRRALLNIMVMRRVFLIEFILDLLRIGQARASCTRSVVRFGCGFRAASVRPDHCWAWSARLLLC
ncbi:hypothetical protein NY536_28525, partial [Enterobacter hormaechei]|nr:hypothetical protein [Enterobacter hormaechei]